MNQEIGQNPRIFRFPVIAALPAPAWARAVGYGWLILDMATDIMQLNGVVKLTYLALRYGANVAAALWIASASWQGKGAMRVIGVIERYKNRDAKAVYSRFKEKGRMMPDGLKYVGSWVEDNFDRCFQLMECDDPRLFQQWLVHWEDLGDFEIVQVVPSAEAADAALSGRDLPRLEPDSLAR